MIKGFGYIVIMFMCCFNLGCSSAPEKNYSVTRYKSLAMTWMARGDRKRQEQRLDQALLNYQTAYKYASLRNDITLMGLSLLKQASVYVDKNQYAQVDDYILQVETMQQYEGINLSYSIQAIQAKQAFTKGNKEKAVALVSGLVTAYETDPEKSVYYRWLLKKYAKEVVDFSALDKDLQLLAALKSAAKLENIEVMSFVMYQNAQWRVERRDKSAVAALKSAITHFSQLELTNRIKDCYVLMAQYYTSIGDTKSASYFQRRVASFSLVP
ncbi:hypothetical protein L1286_11535 [Pseudoalteromonas sp. SMS1]|uniref:hypothetical protein n=1 Tax=Pseudoalteromonas sp. SMS1 TaxID=2908894 RepID=UPI001F16DBE8|nr:hypothetical protein [Pseudoalteromonas sp. SMS1]MCF2858106.1 hypothetical protein [Pseudoalteromonas sp. SMS1]